MFSALGGSNELVQNVESECRVKVSILRDGQINPGGRLQLN